MGVELNCSGAGLFNLAKPVEQALQQAEASWTFEDFLKKYYQILLNNLEKCRYSIFSPPVCKRLDYVCQKAEFENLIFCLLENMVYLRLKWNLIF